MSNLTSEQQDVVQRTRLAMITARSPMLALGKGSHTTDPGTYHCGACGQGGHNARTCGKQPAGPVQKVRVPAKPRLHRVDGKNHCSVCGELGHNAGRHADRDSSSRSARAALACLQDGLTFREAAERFGVSHQGVWQAFRARFPNEPSPVSLRKLSRMRQVTILAVSGKPDDEIAAEVGLSISTVQGIRIRRGILRLRRITDDDLKAAANAVLNGASYSDAAADLGCSADQLANKLRAIGVRSSSTSSGRYGRTARAIARVEAGESIPAACRAERCSTVSVYVHFKRLREARP
jgi:transcriptional regulator with XRE-family HTH domain